MCFPWQEPVDPPEETSKEVQGESLPSLSSGRDRRVTALPPGRRWVETPVVRSMVDGDRWVLHSVWKRLR